MKRDSNIELCRIMAMLMVLLLHANYFSLGGVDWIDFEKAPFDSFLKALAEQLCLICVNVFVLISGWFGIKANIKGGVSLLFQVFFYHILIVTLFTCLGETVSFKTIVKGFCLGHPYWFIIAYLILYAISPVLNAFVEKATPRIFASVLILFFLMEFSYGWMINVAAFNDGYSVMSFIGLYLLAQFIRKYSLKLRNISVCTNFLLYFIFSIVPVVLFFVTGNRFNMTAFSSPFVVLSSVFFFLAFNKMEFSNRIINFFACSALSIYLVHLHPLLEKPFINLMNTAYGMFGGWGYAFFVLVFAVCFGMFCAIIDKSRIFLWKFLCNSFMDRMFSKIVGLTDKIYSYLGL